MKSSDPINQRPDGCAAIAALVRCLVAGSAPHAAGRPASNDNRSSAELLDQYYTEWKVAKHFWDVLLAYLGDTPVLMVEPSAGEGAFFSLMPNGSIGIDLEPRYPGILTGDFLTMTIGGDRDLCFVGNPPFGKNSSLARRFFNRAAREARFIAMILPSTFLKGSMQNTLAEAFHPVYEETVPDDAFRFEGRLCTVPATFMIWERRSEPRDRWPEETRHPDFEFLPSRTGAHFRIQRVGAAAGTVHEDFDKSWKAHYYIRSKRPGVKAVMKRLKPDFVRIASHVSGNPSLAKAEIVSQYRKRTGR